MRCRKNNLDGLKLSLQNAYSRTLLVPNGSLTKNRNDNFSDIDLSHASKSCRDCKFLFDTVLGSEHILSFDDLSRNTTLQDAVLILVYILTMILPTFPSHIRCG